MSLALQQRVKELERALENQNSRISYLEKSIMHLESSVIELLHGFPKVVKKRGKKAK